MGSHDVPERHAVSSLSGKHLASRDLRGSTNSDNQRRCNDATPGIRFGKSSRLLKIALKMA